MTNDGRGKLSAKAANQLEPTNLCRALTGNPVFSGLEETVVERIVRDAGVLNFTADELVYRSGDPAMRLHIVLDGAIQIESPDIEGVRGRAVAIAIAPSIIGECQVLHRRAWSGTGVALTTTSVLCLSREAWMSIVQQCPEVAVGLYEELTYRFLEVIDHRRSSRNAGPSETLARYLCDLRRVFPSGIPPNQSALGQATAIRRETVNRVFRDWISDGVVEQMHNGLRIAQPKVLEALAEGAGLDSLISVSRRVT